MTFEILLAVHLLCAVIWVGGLAFALAVLRPSLAGVETGTQLNVNTQAFRKFFRMIWHVMPIALITGYWMVFGVFGGFDAVPWPIHVMHLFGLIMAALFVWIFLGPWKAMRAAMARLDHAAAASSAGRIRSLMIANFVLGLLTVVVAAFAQ